MATISENLLYECIRELSYVQENDECESDMCASENGKELIERGMLSLQVKELAEDTLDAQKLKEWNKIYSKPAEATDAH